MSDTNTPGEEEPIVNTDNVTAGAGSGNDGDTEIEDAVYDGSITSRE